MSEIREILFRGKTGFDTWVYGEISTWKGTTSIGDSMCHFSVFTETIGQYTGLSDRNGVKIFEGDIIEYKEQYGIARYPVVWDKKTARFAVADYEGMIVGDFFFYTPKKCKIIGNIHDNPELLKGEEK